VLRVANRIGIAEGDDPVIVEEQLCAAMPKARWTRTSDTLILHGRRICRPRPLCDRCVVRDDCDYFRLVIAREAARPPRRRKAAKRAATAAIVKAIPKAGAKPARAAKPTRRGQKKVRAARR
jgi:adenine-specific DNA glycosylase